MFLCIFSLSNGQLLDRVHQHKYHRVVLTDDLTCSTHISEITNKARKIIGPIYRQFYSMSSTLSLLQVYTSLVRPHLEYASQVWDPFLIKDIPKIESFALKMCCKSLGSSYSKNLQQSSLLVLWFSPLSHLLKQFTLNFSVLCCCCCCHCTFYVNWCKYLF